LINIAQDKCEQNSTQSANYTIKAAIISTDNFPINLIAFQFNSNLVNSWH